MAFNTYPYSPFPASTEQLHKGDNEDLQAQIDAIKDGTDIDSFGDVETALGDVTGDITGLETDKADNTVIAPEFDAEAGVYAVGDLVMYQGKLYEFTTAHETAGAWDITEVTEKTVADEINAINSNISTLNGNLTKVANQLFDQNTRVYFKPNYRNNANANARTIKNIPANHVGAIMTSSGIFVFKSNNAGNGFEVPQGSDLSITNTDNIYTFSCPGAWYTMCLFIFTWDPDYEA